MKTTPTTASTPQRANAWAVRSSGRTSVSSAQTAASAAGSSPMPIVTSFRWSTSDPAIPDGSSVPDAVPSYDPRRPPEPTAAATAPTATATARTGWPRTDARRPSPAARAPARPATR
jgi:hypothetical protein